MFTFAKGVAYKMCFCLGLGTATYYSYGQVQHWVKHDQVNLVQNVVEKHVTRETTVYDDTSAPQEFSYAQAPVTAPLAQIGEELKAVAPPAVTEEKKEEEKKTEEVAAEKKDESEAEVAGGVMMPQQNQYPNYGAQGHAPASAAASEETVKAAPLPLLPNALPTPSSGSSGPTLTSGGGSSTNNNTSASSGFLGLSDVVALTSPIKAVFEEKTNHANGLLCTLDENNHANCDHRNHVPVDSLSWSKTQGLKSNVGFAIKSSGVTTVEFDFNFKIQNTALTEENVLMTARPTEILVHNESRDSKTYRVIEFKLPDLTVSESGESLKQVQAMMVYEVTPAGNMILSSGSGLSFTRAKVQVLTSKWDPTDPGRNPADQNAVFLIADELSFSMNIEKSL